MNELTVIDPVAVFNAVKGMDLDTLQNTYAVLPDVETKDGYDLIAAGLKEVKGYRSEVEAIREKFKRPILDAGIALDGEAKRIKGILTGIIEPMADAKRLVDNRKKREKEELEAKLQSLIDIIISIPQKGIGQNSDVIGRLINEVGEIDTDHGYYHRSGEAGIERTKSLNLLTDMMSNAIVSEQAQARLQELEKAEADRLANKVSEDHETAIDLNELFDMRKLAALAKSKKAQDEADKIAKEQAVQAENERLVNEERIREEAIKQARLDADAAAKKAVIDQEKAVKLAQKQAEDKAAKEAEEKERDRLAVIAADKLKADKLAANETHRAKINNAALKCIMKEWGVTKEVGTKMVTDLAKGKIEKVTVNY
ncbi:MAG: hypothetical protein OEM38_09295 [Gammaproteobacteria bacterium]|nr:hypothetical protein [Gammaproteobacteria bacterium]